MIKRVELKDGTAIVIRPMRVDDLERSYAFFRALSEEDRRNLRRDVTRREVVEDRIRTMTEGRVKRLVAVLDDRIVADAGLELEANGWDQHVAEMRLVVAQDCRRKGLGRLMARELYSVAAGEKVEEIVVKVMRPHVAARSIFRKLGFREEVLLQDYVKDVRGKRQDLILMRCDLEGLWQELEDFIVTGDWQRVR